MPKVPDKRIKDIKSTAHRTKKAVPGGHQEISRLRAENRKAVKKKRVAKTLTHRAKRAVKRATEARKKK